MATIQIIEGDNAGTTLPLVPEGFVIGRKPDCNLAIGDDMASGHHAKLSVENGQWMLTDMNSTNGTLLNSQPVTSVALSEGDVIQIGSTQMRFTPDGESRQAQAQSEPAVSSRPPPAARAGASSKEPVTDASAEDLKLVEQMQHYTEQIRTEVAKIIVGQKEVLDQVLMAMIAGGHALLIGLPGMAKTTMISTIAKVLDMQFKRVQFTPDLMPTDITGSEVLETDKATGDKGFRFIKGPIFCNLMLADEINRTPPKTQASLLEAMQEHKVTVGNTTYTLDEPFFVLATQNPIEQEGTYPLPEAQMDRFMFNIWVDYPLEHEEEQIISATTVQQKVQPEKVLSKQQVLQLQQVVRKIPVSDHVIKYTIRMVRATRPVNEHSPQFIKEYVSTGSGPRAGQYLILAAKARAVMEGRIHVSCNDIRSAAIPVLRHRIFTNFAADSEGLTSMDLVKRLLEEVKEPGENDYDGEAKPETTAPEKEKQKKGFFRKK